MEQKLEEIQKEDKETAEEYCEFIKNAVNDGSYFKDALNWYFFRYVTPICDRTLLIFGAMIAAVVLYFLYQMIQSAFPLVEKVPVFIEARDQSQYFPALVELKPKKSEPGYDSSVTTVDEAVLKYLLKTYVSDREGYDFRKAAIEDVNTKFNRIRNVSSPTEYRNFQLVMSKDNPNSPIHNFGQNVEKIINVESVRFVKVEPKDFSQKALQYLSNKIPTQAEVRFIADVKTVNEDQTVTNIKEKYLARISYQFAGVKKDEKGGSVIKFTVEGYQLFKVK